MISLFQKTIKKEDVERRRKDGGAHRIAFAYTHTDQPRRSAAPHFGGFSVPFSETIKRLFEADTGLELPASRFGAGFWRSIKTEEEFKLIADWVKRQGTRIFLRDCLDLSVALDQNLIDNRSGKYTPLGELESRAKERPDQPAIQRLAKHYCTAIRDLPGYREATYIAAVPARPGKTYDLPTALAKRIAEELQLPDLTSKFRFREAKDSIKLLGVDEKWDAWEQTGLNLEQPMADAPSVILIDDKYQSGITIQYVASRLYAAGAREVFGLCAVKTLRDTDNA